MAIEYLKCFKRVTPRINITYKCNMFSYCKYCYSKEELKRYKDDMTVQDFKNIIRWFKEAYNIDDVVFLGGESTFHPELEKFGKVLDSENIGCFIFTNGCFNNEKLEIIKKIKAFHTVFFHYEQEFLDNPNLRKIFLRNLDELSKNKKIVFRYNTGNPDFDFQELIALSKKYNAYIAYSFTSPSVNRKIDYVKITDMKKYIPRLLEFIKTAHENGIELLDKRPLPLCVFDEKDIDMVKKIGGVRCVCCVGSVCVNPDLSLIAAPTLTTIRTSPVENKKDLEEKVEFLQQAVEKLKWDNPTITECVDCKHWKNHECQGGCTTYKLCEKLVIA
jgi:organic radical activating enzyme